ncbi:hypothetical protein [Rhodoferax sp.]|uniref:hypothetical protein n=1 Tax=Rhodoferax sp. TaxID=50421 RepID=UPI002ACD7ADD|nr:hypothetical protein [Rhodoferax sp.]MDZ7919986.1 hypothetical protein [Rhodoferax sp.]
MTLAHRCSRLLTGLCADRDAARRRPSKLAVAAVYRRRRVSFAPDSHNHRSCTLAPPLLTAADGFFAPNVIILPIVPAVPGIDWAPPLDLATSAVIGQALRFMRLPPVARFDPAAEVLTALAEAHGRAMDECLEAADWSFASVLASLPGAALPPGDIADDSMPHGYQLPGDLIQLRQVIPANAVWRIDQGLMRADQPGPMAIRYTARVTLEAVLPAQFQLAVSLTIAAMLGARWAGGVVSGDDMAGQAHEALKLAMRNDARSAAPTRGLDTGRGMDAGHDAGGDLGYGDADGNPDWGWAAVA